MPVETIPFKKGASLAYFDLHIRWNMSPLKGRVSLWSFQGQNDVWISFSNLQKMSKVSSRGFDNWHRCGKSFRRCFDNCQSLERVHDTVRQSLSGRHVSHLTSGRCAFSYVLTSYISLVPLQVRGAEKDETEKSRRSMLAKRANPIELYNQQNIRFVIKHFELQIYLIAQIKLWSTRSKLLVTKMSWHSSASCVYACIYVFVLCNYRTQCIICTFWSL